MSLAFAGMSDQAWLRIPPTDSAEIAQRYDNWALTYDQDLVDEWRYDAPSVAAGLVIDVLSQGDRTEAALVLDVGCGTGLVGAALRSSVELGIEIDGVDLSEASLRMANERGVYRLLAEHDFNQRDLPMSDQSYDAVVCVGVLSYAIDPVAVVRDFCRVVRSGGVVVFTHRTDLWDQQNVAASLRHLQSMGLVSGVSWSEPMSYMPGNADYEDLRIRYVTLLVE